MAHVLLCRGPEKVALQQVSFVGDKFYAFGASGSYESDDGVSFLGGTRSSPDAAIGGLLVSLASDPEAHFLAGRRVPDPPRVFISQDGGSSYFSLPLSVSDAGVDCASVPCVVSSARTLAE